MTDGKAMLQNEIQQKPEVLQKDQSPQQRMAALLAKAGLHADEIRCYGSQVMITVGGYKVAEKWAALLAKFCATVRAPRESWEPVKADADKSRPRHYKVWRVWGTV